MPTPIVGLAGYAALPVVVRGFILTMFDLGITTALNHVAIQLFVAVLKPTIGDEMMKVMSVLLWGALQQAITLVKIHMPLKTNTPMVNEVAEEQEALELDGEIKFI
jgi:hypothetical protein